MLTDYHPPVRHPKAANGILAGENHLAFVSHRVSLETGRLSEVRVAADPNRRTGRRGGNLKLYMALTVRPHGICSVHDRSGDRRAA